MTFLIIRKVKKLIHYNNCYNSGKHFKGINTSDSWRLRVRKGLLKESKRNSVWKDDEEFLKCGESQEGERRGDGNKEKCSGLRVGG